MNHGQQEDRSPEVSPGDQPSEVGNQNAPREVEPVRPTPSVEPPKHPKAPKIKPPRAPQPDSPPADGSGRV